VATVIQDLLVFLQPQLLRWLLAYISAYQAAHHSPMPGDPETGPSAIEGFAIAIIMFVAAVIQSIFLNQVRSSTF
jgi:ATP-binding cassette, subfamily C (CFTR/MRP), member 1